MKTAKELPTNMNIPFNFINNRGQFYNFITNKGMFNGISTIMIELRPTNAKPNLTLTVTDLGQTRFSTTVFF